jgi:hypothetical protein
MQNLKEIVTVEEFNRWVQAFAVACLGLSLLLGLVLGGLRRRLLYGLTRGLAIGLFGPLVWGLWRLYGHLIRYDPQTGYCGLHRISVLLLNVVLFIVVGIALGAVYGRLFRPVPKEEQTGA